MCGHWGHIPTNRIGIVSVSPQSKKYCLGAWGRIYKELNNEII